MDHAAVAADDGLRLAEDRVEGRTGLLVLVVDPAERDELRDDRPELPEEPRVARLDPLVHRGRNPRPDRPVVDRAGRQLRPWIGHDGPGDAGDDREIAANLTEDNVLPEIGRARPVEDDLAGEADLLARTGAVDDGPGDDVEQLDLRVADDEPARLSGRERDLQARRGATRCVAHHPCGAIHRRLHLESAGDGRESMLLVEPARDRVARERHDASVVAVDGLRECVEDPVDPGRHALGALLRPE